MSQNDSGPAELHNQDIGLGISLAILEAQQLFDSLNRVDRETLTGAAFALQLAKRLEKKVSA